MPSGLLDVDGAKLYYETRGAGPALVLISGAGGDAGLFTGVADQLADAFTVITYDRRGNSRSTGRTDAPMVLTQQADDANSLIGAVAGGKALVFGSSGGAIVALDLCARYPGSVLAAVAHEPPVFGMLSPDVPGAAFYDQMSSLYQQLGTEAMGHQFASAMGEDGFVWPEDLLHRFLGNIDYLFGKEWQEWAKFLPDIDALTAADAPLVLAGAAANRGLLNSIPGVEIAARTGSTWMEFPGVHLEFFIRPLSFAAALRAVFTHLFTAQADLPQLWRVPR